MNIQPYIILNNIDSRTISGLLISSLAPISKPLVRTQVETVDGRSGDIVTPLGFSAYDKVIKISDPLRDKVTSPVAVIVIIGLE